jgi:hypothetical protein
MSEANMGEVEAEYEMSTGVNPMRERVVPEELSQSHQPRRTFRSLPPPTMSESDAGGVGENIAGSCWTG